MQRLVQLLGWALTVVVMGCSQTDDLPLGDDALPEAVCGRDACDCDQACLAADACDALADRSVGDCILACVDGGLDVSFSCDLNDACDASCVQLRERSVGRVELYGTWPAVQRPSGGWRRQCDPGPTDGLIIDLLLMSSAADGSEAPAREGDWLQGQRALTGDGRLLAPHTLLSDLEIDTLSDEPRIDLLVAGLPTILTINNKRQSGPKPPR